MDAELVERVRRFNRTVTQRVGALEDAFLSRGRPLGHCRVLWEIGERGSEVRLLRARLDLDSGYLSRILRTLEGDGLVIVESDPDDARVRRARLTGKGLGERAELDRRSDDQAASILRPLDPRQRERLVTAMAEVERLLVASMVEVAVADPRHPDARYSLGEYFAELARRFPKGFDPGRGVPAGADDLTLPRGLILVARLHSDPVGCGALKLRGGSAHLKRMWVAPAVRGLGLGRRLLAELEARAAEHGAATVRLETHAALTEARQLYRTAGYREVAAFNDEPYAAHWFEKTLRGQASSAVS
ncbi:GNAT family N-acetyltransferase [Nonomuraea typhae]|uniref:GNAT family N-acetyltransferase n=1 Tax=Nonomuraea typhae TaxID=2603600 RepID=A0ABW7Z5P4_9ACTN